MKLGGCIGRRHYRPLWRDLHSFALSSVDPRERAAFLDQFLRRLAGLRCEQCLNHWQKIVAAHPPDTATQERFFTWTVRAHNEVNRTLGKPIVTLPAAMAQLRNAARLPANPKALLPVEA